MNRAVLDANVLFPQMLRDVLVSLAARRAFDARWTNQIHDEWTRNVARQRPDISPDTLRNVRTLMNDNVPGCMVEGFELLIETLELPDPNDRHVLAAAIHSQAPFIVTFNLKDFPASALSPHGIIAQSPDEFLPRVLESRPNQSLEALAKQRARFYKPALSREQFLDELRRQGLPRFASALEPFQNQL